MSLPNGAMKPADLAGVDPMPVAVHPPSAPGIDADMLATAIVKAMGILGGQPPAPPSTPIAVASADGGERRHKGKALPSGRVLPAGYQYDAVAKSLAVNWSAGGRTVSLTASHVAEHEIDQTIATLDIAREIADRLRDFSKTGGAPYIKRLGQCLDQTCWLLAPPDAQRPTRNNRNVEPITEASRGRR